MSDASAEQKQAVIRQMLQDLASSQAPTVEVRLSAQTGDGSRNDRGLLNPAPRPATAASLHLGQELQVVVSSPQSGYLHLFNLGSSGEVRRMLPRPGAAPAALAPGHPYLALASPDSPWIEKGPLNGFPERVLAIVTTEPNSVLPSALHPSFNDTAVARGFSPPVIASLLSAWPIPTWSWGIGEALLAR